MTNNIQISCQLISSDEAILKSLIEKKFPLIGMPYGLKQPIHRDWNQRKNVIDSTEKLSKLSGINFGLAHAFCSPTPTLALDCDNFRQTIQWFLERDIDLLALKNASDAVGILSGKPNSAKLIYRLPEGMSALPSVAVTDANGGTIFEIRCATSKGLTVQDLIPPSLHPSGTRYKWTGAGSILTPPTIPAPLLNIWQELLEVKKTKRKPRIPHRQSIPETKRQVATLNHLLSFINADCGYETYRNIVWAIASTGWSCSYQIALNWSLTAEHRFDEHTLDALFYSYDPDRDDRITIGTIYHYAKQGGA
jgi:putative DNA primase/helicase